MKIAVDWSLKKKFATYDGTKSKKHDNRASFLSWLRKLGHNTDTTVILEQGCPYSLVLDIQSEGNPVSLISNKATKLYRVEHGIPKTDEGDATIIWNLANSRPQDLKPALKDYRRLRLRFLYRKFSRYQKARITAQHIERSQLRYFPEEQLASGDPSTDCATRYHSATEALLEAEKAAMKEATDQLSRAQSKSIPPRPRIRGLGNRIWIGILATANPVDFKCRSSYVRFCGLTQDAKESKNYSRQAKKLYHQLAIAVAVRHKNEDYVPIYDRWKLDIKAKHPDYDDNRVEKAALIRIATLLANDIFKYIKPKTVEAGE